MWEFCVNLSDKNLPAAKRIYLALKDFCKDYNGIVTTYERCGSISVLISADTNDSSRIKHFLVNVICDVICDDFKLEYLKQNLSLPSLDEISKNAFLQALVSFDKESDKYLTARRLELDKQIDVEAFYYFKLQELKNKWKELVQIANDNKAYLASNDTLVELLKFLVDNLEIKNDSVNLILKNNKVCLCDGNFNLLKEVNLKQKDIDSTIISDLISFAPKIVNVYCRDVFSGNLISLLKQIFDKRINFLQTEEIY